MKSKRYYVLQGGRGQINHAAVRGTRTTLCGLGPPYALQKITSHTRINCPQCITAARSQRKEK